MAAWVGHGPIFAGTQSLDIQKNTLSHQENSLFIARPIFYTF